MKVPLGKGIFLVAAPSLRDPNFRQTVVLLCEHGAEGALGRRRQSSQRRCRSRKRCRKCRFWKDNGMFSFPEGRYKRTK